MPKLDYVGGRWEGTLEREDGEKIHIHMSDATLQKHYHAYLESIGVLTKSPHELQREMVQYIQQVEAEQWQAWQHMLELEGWLACTDPDVRILSTCWQRYAHRNGRTPTNSPI
jgi:hypothetical protein